jgi:hypothetical protein
VLCNCLHRHYAPGQAREGFRIDRIMRVRTLDTWRGHPLDCLTRRPALPDPVLCATVCCPADEYAWPRGMARAAFSPHHCAALIPCPPHKLLTTLGCILGTIAQEVLCTPGLLHDRCAARCCLRPRGLVSHCPSRDLTHGLHVGQHAQQTPKLSRSQGLGQMQGTHPSPRRTPTATGSGSGWWDRPYPGRLLFCAELWHTFLLSHGVEPGELTLQEITPSAAAVTMSETAGAATGASHRARVVVYAK